ncbi:hypothetical protein BJY00DRAFT_271258 [Aspergillus carlsbadensis]|nr:hypothetical protein BJY00DRAFT_271258 [Aspergillus carlsbadensis]
MGVLPTYQQATQGASRNGFKNLRYRSRKGPVLAIFSVIMCFLLAGAIWATIKAN